MTMESIKSVRLTATAAFRTTKLWYADANTLNGEIKTIFKDGFLHKALSNPFRRKRRANGETRYLNRREEHENSTQYDAWGIQPTKEFYP